MNEDIAIPGLADDMPQSLSRWLRGVERKMQVQGVHKDIASMIYELLNGVDPLYDKSTRLTTEGVAMVCANTYPVKGGGRTSLGRVIDVEIPRRSTSEILDVIDKAHPIPPTVRDEIMDMVTIRQRTDISPGMAPLFAMKDDETPPSAELDEGAETLNTPPGPISTAIAASTRPRATYNLDAAPRGAGKNLMQMFEQFRSVGVTEEVWSRALRLSDIFPPDQLLTRNLILGFNQRGREQVCKGNMPALNVFDAVFASADTAAKVMDTGIPAAVREINEERAALRERGGTFARGRAAKELNVTIPEGLRDTFVNEAPKWAAEIRTAGKNAGTARG